MLKSSLASHLSVRPTYTHAYSILGDDFVTPEEVAKKRPDLTYSSRQTAMLTDSIPSIDALTWCKEHDYAVGPGSPHVMSLLDVRLAKPSHFYGKTWWYLESEHAFSNTATVSPGWIAIRKEPVLQSVNKNWEEQYSLLSEIEYVPNVAELTWFMTVFYDVHSVLFFPAIYVRTSSSFPDYYGLRHVYAGINDGEGIDIMSAGHDNRLPYLGLASALHLDS